MWLVPILGAAAISFLLFALLPQQRKRYRLGLLSLMLFGLSLLVFADKFFSMQPGEPFLEEKTDGIIENTFVLGLLMLAPVVAVWLFATFTQAGKKVFSFDF
ncbi:MAG: hypothetical protein N3G80_01625 [Candidatus Micrarchaeota archaeon]|nr:hypothetical protein [Candidatus Micrarchaeota archaeon]